MQTKTVKRKHCTRNTWQSAQTALQKIPAVKKVLHLNLETLKNVAECLRYVHCSNFSHKNFLY